MKMMNLYTYTFQKKKTSHNSPKLWLLSTGIFVRANMNDNRIPANDLRKIMRKLAPQAEYIRNYWIAYHGYEKYKDLEN